MFVISQVEEYEFRLEQFEPRLSTKTVCRLGSKQFCCRGSDLHYLLDVHSSSCQDFDSMLLEGSKSSEVRHLRPQQTQIAD